MQAAATVPSTDTVDMVALFVANAHSDDCRISDKDSRIDWDKVAEAMGWARDDLDAFRAENADLILTCEEMRLSAMPDVKPPTEAELMGKPAAGDLSVDPTDEQVALAIAHADLNLTRGLEALGMQGREVEKAIALQRFNKEYFKESMDMISSGVLVTALKIQNEQEEIQTRIKFVREQIKAMGDASGKIRESWTREEKVLVQQFIEMGELLNRIQDTWYRGAAYLAVVRSRLRGEGACNPKFGSERTQRRNKPGFRPTVTVNPITPS